jgi:hypothetical protein
MPTTTWRYDDYKDLNNPDWPSLELRSLPVGTKIVAKTKNSVYNMQLVDPKTGQIKIQGGKRWPKEANAYLHGYSLGGSMLFCKSVSIDVFLEIAEEGKRTVRTTAVEELTITTPDNSFQEN